MPENRTLPVPGQPSRPRVDRRKIAAGDEISPASALEQPVKPRPVPESRIAGDRGRRQGPSPPIHRTRANTALRYRDSGQCTEIG